MATGPLHLPVVIQNRPARRQNRAKTEVLASLKTWCAFYALKHEIGADGKLHVHLGIMLEMCTSATNGGAKTASNLKTFMLKRRAPTVLAVLLY